MQHRIERVTEISKHVVEVVEAHYTISLFQGIVHFKIFPMTPMLKYPSASEF